MNVENTKVVLIIMCHKLKIILFAAAAAAVAYKKNKVGTIRDNSSGQYLHQTKNVCPGCARTKTGNQQKTGSVCAYSDDKARGYEP